MSGAISPPSGQGRRVPGTFTNNIWYCACDPPLEASFLETKKAGKNHGRWFYTCKMPFGHQCGFFEWEDISRVLEKKAQTAEKRAEPSVFNRPLAAQINSAAGPSNGSPAGNRTPATANHTRNNANYSLGRVARSDTPLSEAASSVTAPFYSPASSVFPTPAPRQGIFRGIPRLGDKSWSSDDEDSDATADMPAKKSPTKSAGKSPATYQTNISRYFVGLSTPTPKRKRSAVDDGGARGNSSGTTRNDAVIIVSDLDSDGADELVELADSTERQHQSNDAPSSPSTARGSTRSGFGGLPTPETGNSFASDRSGASKRFKNAQGLAAPPTPTPTRNRNAFPGAAAAAAAAALNNHPPPPTHYLPTTTTTTSHHEEAEADDAPLTTSILTLLRSHSPDGPSPETERALRHTLNTHARRARGFERARDGLRETLRTRDRCIADLRARVERLEGERRMRWEVLRSDLEALSQGGEAAANGGGGGGNGGEEEE